jgi:DNA-binding MarR family transcriptional regulator
MLRRAKGGHPKQRRTRGQTKMERPTITGILEILELLGLIEIFNLF